MIKTRQKNIKVFEFSGGNTQEYIEFITKNLVLLKDYLFVFKHKIEENLQVFLDETNITYVVSEAELKGRDVETPKISNTPSQAKIYHRNIRSGEEIEALGDVVLLANVGNGAKISTDGNVAIFGRCDGVVICGGEYIILRAIHSGHIIFQGEIVSAEIIKNINLSDCLKIITKNGDTISIKEIK